MLCGLMGLGVSTSAETGRPRLVVGIMVDQLRTDYLENLQGLFSDKGFNRLLQEGIYMPDIDYRVTNLDPVTSTAILYTGNYPRYNGITSSKVYSPAAKDMVFALADPASIGNFTTETFSPANLRLSTISDELAVFNDGKGAVYSIAPDAQQSVVMAGHAGNSAFWINENTGNWASTTYYLDNPSILTQKNYTSPLTSRLDTLVWRPVNERPLPGKSKDTDYTFVHRFPTADRSVFKMYAASPMANSEVTDAALEYIETLGLGKDGGETDMLNLAFTAAPYNFEGLSSHGAELEDTYLRLDKDLERLFDALDKNVGMDNVLIYLASTGYFDDGRADDQKFRLPTGNFSVKRALSLLNSYLAAQYGNGSYVDTYSDSHVYLNRKEIEEKKLDLREVAEVSRDFLVRMSGVNDAFTMADIMGSALPSMEALRLGTDPKTGGDIILEFNAGWNIVDDTRFPNDVKVERSSAALTPAFIMGNGIKPEVIEKTVDAIEIAPTLARLLRIRSPNGATAKSLVN